LIELVGFSNSKAKAALIRGVTECDRDKSPISKEERFERESESTRGNIEKLKNGYWKEDHYLDLLSPLTSADMVISSY
jgi:hypothetical protein